MGVMGGMGDMGNVWWLRAAHGVAGAAACGVIKIMYLVL